MDKNSEINSNFKIKLAKREDLTELTLCAKEFIELIEKFKLNFLDGKYLTLIIYYNNLIAGVLIAQELIPKVDSIENILPKTLLKLIYVNPNFRNKLIGTTLLLSFLKNQKEKGVASVFIKLPQKYKSGIKFFETNNFRRVGKTRDNILLEFNLWNDFGIRFSEFLAEDLNHIFD
jgi:GNAT superfamily N-acetyltransferase